MVCQEEDPRRARQPHALCRKVCMNFEEGLVCSNLCPGADKSDGCAVETLEMVGLDKGLETSWPKE